MEKEHRINVFAPEVGYKLCNSESDLQDFAKEVMESWDDSFDIVTWSNYLQNKQHTDYFNCQEHYNGIKFCLANNYIFTGSGIYGIQNDNVVRNDDISFSFRIKQFSNEQIVKLLERYKEEISDLKEEVSELEIKLEEETDYAGELRQVLNQISELSDI